MDIAQFVIFAVGVVIFFAFGASGEALFRVKIDE
jgi:hypothetical protein